MNELVALDWTEILHKMAALATSEPGRNRVLAAAPFAEATQARQRFQENLHAGAILSMGYRPHLASLDIYPTWSTRLKKNAVLKPLELRDLRHFFHELLALREAMATVDNPWTRRLHGELMDATDPLSDIDDVLTAGGEIRSDASHHLSQLMAEKDRLAREVQTSLDRLVKDHDMENLLQDRFVTTREGRWVLPIRSGMQHHMPGVIHGSSQSKQTVFMEPDRVIPLNNRLRQIDVDIEEEIERILTELSHRLQREVPAIEASRRLMEDADALFAQAQFTLQVRGVAVEFSDEVIELNELRHPLLEGAARSVVANSVRLTPQKSILLLSGPNAGGKTVLLKSVGLAAQMARCGMPVCVNDGSRLPFFRDILIGIGDAQSVDEELSTFAAHLRVLSQATGLRGRQSLVLIDEIAGSTDPEEGSALARAFIETFARAGVFAVITSHLGPLKSGWKDDEPILNGSMEYDLKTGRPTYHFIAGIPGDSLALQTARRIGVDGAILDRAVQLLSPATRSRLEGLEQIERLKSDIHILQEGLRQQLTAASAAQKKYESLAEQLQKEKDQWLAKTVRQAEKKVDEAIQQAKVEDVFRRHRELSQIKHQLPEIVKARPIDSGTVANAEDFARRFPPGSKVLVPSLGSDGLVQSEPNSKGEVMVLAGSIRLLLPWAELKPPGKAPNPTADLVRRAVGVQISLRDNERTLDLRGKTVDEALQELELALDHAATHREDRLKIVHGHGTEALKRAVRTYLSRSVYVKKWKAGPPDGGGDGVTWAELNLDN